MSDQQDQRRTGRRLKLAVVGAGVVAAGVVATTVGVAAAAQGGPSSTAVTPSAVRPTQGWPDTDGHRSGRHGGPRLTGTVTAVGSSSVTIKTSGGTATYGVTSSSDIDKNGEAKLSDLKVGDAVRFSTTTSAGKTVIDKLHAGNEQLDHPKGSRGHRDGSGDHDNGATGPWSGYGTAGPTTE